MPAIALDLDRVLFDTNRYMDILRERLRLKGLSFDAVANRSAVFGRKDLTNMVRVVAEQIGKSEAEALFFTDILHLWEGGAAGVFSQIREKFEKVFVVTVGDGYQSRKISGLDIDGIFVVSNDNEKVNIASALHQKYPDLVFVDDKAEVISRMSECGIRGFQACWFLDEAHQSNALPNRLTRPEELLEL
ncbi:MAG TPA: hypothetical protein ENN60_03430 [archaeon]|nr:hypothetical protein [archaeon]